MAPWGSYNARNSRFSALNMDLARVLPHQPNAFFSSLSLDIVLMVVGGGATGCTLAELESALRWGNFDAALRESVDIIAQLQAVSQQESGGPVLSIANAVFAKVPLKPEYTAALSGSGLRADLAPLESAGQVNAWVSEKTRGMIRGIVDDQTVHHSLMIAVNAIYFKGKWLAPFNPSLTRQATFHTPGGPGSCMLMESSLQEWGYHEDSTAQFSLLPYVGSAPATGGFGSVTGGVVASDISAMVILPRDPANTSILASVDLAQACSACQQKREGRIWLPRFKAESELRLSAPLQQLGAKTAFTGEASFPRISDVPLMVSDVLQRAVVEFDEEGTEAAVATAVLATFSGPPRQHDASFEMRCDRPFGFVLIRKPSGTPILSGVITSPGGAPQPTTATTAPFPPAPAPQVQPLNLPGWQQGFQPSFKPSQPAANPFNPPTAAQPSQQAAAPTFVFQPSLPAATPFNPPAPAHPPQQVAAPTPTAWEREAQLCLFTPACKRDVYRILCSPPRQRLSTPPLPAQEAGCLTPLRWCFNGSQLQPAQRHSADPLAQRTLELVETIGHPSSPLTEAFEKLLVAEYVPWWSDADTATLSVPFIFAFGIELSPRLDINHTIRSRTLSAEEITWLRGLPETVHFERRLLDVFQGGSE